MPTNYVMLDNDTVSLVIPGAIIPAAQGPQPLVATSTDLTGAGARVCLEGDELPPALRVPLNYSEPSFPVAGTGTLKLTPIKGVNTTTVLSDGGKAVLLKGSPFTAVFTITNPAKTPKGEPAPAAPKSGTATFATKNDFFTAD